MIRWQSFFEDFIGSYPNNYTCEAEGGAVPVRDRGRCLPILKNAPIPTLVAGNESASPRLAPLLSLSLSRLLLRCGQEKPFTSPQKRLFSEAKTCISPSFSSSVCVCVCVLKLLLQMWKEAGEGGGGRKGRRGSGVGGLKC